MKYALIGCGRIATNHVKAALLNNLEFVAACDLKIENIEQLLEKHGLEENKSIEKYNRGTSGTRFSCNCNLFWFSC